MCHTSYVTEYSPVKETLCEDIYEKKCHIETTEITINETVTVCKKPLERVCTNQGMYFIITWCPKIDCAKLDKVNITWHNSFWDTM